MQRLLLICGTAIAAVALLVAGLYFTFRYQRDGRFVPAGVGVDAIGAAFFVLDTRTGRICWAGGEVPKTGVAQEQGLKICMDDGAEREWRRLSKLSPDEFWREMTKSK